MNRENTAHEVFTGQLKMKQSGIPLWFTKPLLLLMLPNLGIVLSIKIIELIDFRMDLDMEVNYIIRNV